MISSRRLTRFLIPAMALGWLLSQAWGSLPAGGIMSCIIIGSLCFPSRPRRRRRLILVLSMILSLLFLAWILLLSSGIKGPPALGLFIGGILLFALLIPTLYALGFPEGDPS